MTGFLLVHGSCHGSWCWRDTIPALEARGHVAKAIDLPGHGADRTPPGDVTLDRYADAVVAALQGFDAPPVVVGHSMGGYPVTLAAARAPDRLAGLVYLCAYTPWPGLSLAAMRQQADTQPLVPAIRRNPDGVSMHFDPAEVPRLFYHDCPPATLDYALPRLCDQPLAPMQVALADADCAPGVPRGYIICEDDRAVPPAFQTRMAARLDPARVGSLPCAHSPFFAMPERLADLLGSLA